MRYPWVVPNLLKKYPAIPSRKSFNRLERQVIKDFISKEYQNLDKEYNVFYLYHQVPSLERNSISGDVVTKRASSQLLWRKHNESVGSQLRILDKPLYNGIFRQLIDPTLSTEWLKPNTHIGFQSIKSLNQLLLDDSSLRYNYGTSNSIETYMLGIRININKKINGLDEIEPLLEETSNMYKNLDYESLLAIAKKNRKPSLERGHSGVITNDRNVAKQFLDRLAHSKMIYPTVTSNSHWLIFRARDKDNITV